MRFKKSQTCQEINGIIDDLEVNEIVSFAAHCYKGEFCFGLDCTEIMSYSNEFVVSLNNASDFSRLQNLCESTDTWIYEDKEYYFLIRVDKNSQGNALQMANYFYESGLFYYSHPNFHYFNIE